MGIVRIEFMFLEKNISEDTIIKDIIIDQFKRLDENCKQDSFTLSYKAKDYLVKYEFHSRQERLYLSIECDARINQAVAVIELASKSIFCPDVRKKSYIIVAYDGVSEYYCDRLYPKFAEFERKLRQMILIILIKAYGANWFSESATEDVKNKTSEIARGSNKLVEKAIESMDFSTMQEFLFEPHIPEYAELLENEFSVDNLKDKSADELRSIIDSTRPKSLWENCFQRIGDKDTWATDIESVRKTRNSIAHNKSITGAEFDSANKKIVLLNKQLKDHVLKLQDEEFTDIKSFNILNAWAQIIPNLVSSDSYKQMIKSISVAMQGLAAAMNLSLQSPTTGLAVSMANAIGKLALQTNTDYMENIRKSFIKLAMNGSALSAYERWGISENNSHVNDEESTENIAIEDTTED